ncbi:MAG: dihydrofolate reductase [Patescibacteria group bacterium]|nr:MAG: dihydrofolate reductase [Patescibacteria group bacterium]
MGKNRVIGRDNKLPWRLPADMKRFRELTLGKAVVMGRRTFESIGRPLLNRVNIILTHDPAFEARNCLTACSVDEVLRLGMWHEEIVIIGGASVYEQFLPLADVMHLTLIDAEFEGDAYFPAFKGEWNMVEEHRRNPDDANPYPFSFTVFQKRRKL